MPTVNLALPGEEEPDPSERFRTMDSGSRMLAPLHFSLACPVVSRVHELRIKMKTFGTQTKNLAGEIISFNVMTVCVCVCV